jgi:hypothetical protein
MGRSRPTRCVQIGNALRRQGGGDEAERRPALGQPGRLFDTPALHDKLTTRGAGRTILFGLTYNLGAQNPRNRKDPAFDFQQPAPEGGQQG